MPVEQEEVAMGRRSRFAYDYELGRREVETDAADRFEAEFPIVTGRTVRILSLNESPDRITLIGGIETGVELTSINAGSADDVIAEVLRLAGKSRKATNDAASAALGQSSCWGTW
jgi:hypothetical protein